LFFQSTAGGTTPHILVAVATLYCFHHFFYTKNCRRFLLSSSTRLNELGYLKYSVLVLLKSVLLLFAHLLFCYAIIYFLLQNYFLKRKYLHLLTGVLLLCALAIPTSYFLYSLVYPLADRLFHLHTIEINKKILWTSISAGLIGSIKVTLVAVVIASIKRWWGKTKRKRTIGKRKDKC
jgi:hypothetical protein